MDFIDNLIQYDKELLVFLNGLGNENWDSFWMLITTPINWIPLFLIFFYLIFKTFGWKKGLVFIIITALMAGFSDQLTVFIKDLVGRLRPNQNTELRDIIRLLKDNKSFSFVSGHATTSTAVSLLMYLTLKKYYKYTILFFIWPILFAYSRIYIGVHFPIDVAAGALLGLLIGYLFYKLSIKVLAKVDTKKIMEK